MNEIKILKKVTTLELEVAVVSHFGSVSNLIVPNIKWGWGLHYEADLVVLTKSDYAYEVELKVSKADLKHDLSKRHTHNDPIFRGLWFAMPEEIIDEKLIPEKAGILSYGYQKTEEPDIICGVCMSTEEPDGSPDVTFEREITVIRRPKTRKNAQRISEEKRMKLESLGCMRLWGLKKHLLNCNQRYEEMIEEHGKS